MCVYVGICAHTCVLVCVHLRVHAHVYVCVQARSQVCEGDTCTHLHACGGQSTLCILLCDGLSE